MSLKAKLYAWGRRQEKYAAHRWGVDLWQKPPLPWAVEQTTLGLELQRALTLRYPRGEHRPVLLQAMPKAAGSWVSLLLAESLGRFKVMKLALKQCPAQEDETWGPLHAYFTDMTKLSPEALQTYEHKPVLLHAHLAPTDDNLRLLREHAYEPIYLSRDLRDMLVSWYFHLGTLDNELGQTVQALPQPEGLDLVLDQFLAPFAQFQQRWVDFFQTHFPQRILTFEEIQQDPLSALRRVVNDVGASVSDAHLRAVLAKYQKPTAKHQNPDIKADATKLRKGIVGDWKNQLTPAQAERIEAAM